MTGGTETLLLVEDDDDVRATAFGMLKDLGYNILQAPDPETALKIARDGAHIDLLFTDVVMPGQITGHGLAQSVRGLHPDLPVLFTSGYVQDSIVHDGQLDAGVQLLGKPYTHLGLAQKIREVLELEGVIIESPIPTAQTEMVQKTESQQLMGLRILLCEDDVFIRMDFAQGLRSAGCEVLEAGSAQEAIELLKVETVDLLVTDVGLPDRSGEDLATEMRGFRPDLPVIFATGGVDVPAAAQLGHCRVITKPFRDTELLELIRQMVPSQP